MISDIITTRVKLLYPDSIAPVANWENAGYDVYTHRILIKEDLVYVYTGIAVAPEKGFYFDLVPRSSIYKKGLILNNSVGVIDNGYRGEIIGIFRHFKGSIMPEPGERVLQLVLRRQINAIFQAVDELDSTNRGENNFGSTGA